MDANTFIELMSAACTIIVLVITSFLIPWLKAKIGVEQWNLIRSKAETFVRAAKQIFSDDPKDNEAKKEYVVNKVTTVIQQMNISNISEDQVSDLIEGVYQQIKAAEGK